MAQEPGDGVGERFLDALGRRDFAALGACFTGDARLRALVPAQLREADGPDAIVDRYRYWYAGLEDFELVDSEVGRIADRLRLRYRLRGTHAEDGPMVVEHEGYAVLEDDRIRALNVVCSGFRPPA